MSSRPGRLIADRGSAADDRRERPDRNAVRRRRSNRPGNSQAKGPDGRRRSGKQPAARPAHRRSNRADRVRKAPGAFPGKCSALFRPEERPATKAREISQVLGQRGRERLMLGPSRDRCSGSGDRMAEAASNDLKETPLAALHRELGARMVPFAGYSMPVQYPTGIIAEHNQVRDAAGLFDVSHMGQALPRRPRSRDDGAGARSADAGRFRRARPGRERYTLLLTEDGGIIDDLMVTRPRLGRRRRPAVAGRQRRAQGRRLCRLPRPAAGFGHARADGGPGAARPAGAGGRRGHGPPRRPIAASPAS